MIADLVLIVLMIWNLGPLFLLVGGFLAVSKHRTGRDATARKDIFSGLILSVVGTGSFIFFMLLSLFRSSDPQSPLGLLFTPALSWPVAVITFGVGWCGSVLIRYVQGSVRRTEQTTAIGGKKLLGVLCFIVISIVGTGFVCYRLAPYSKAESEDVSADELRKLFSQASRRNHDQILLRLAQNPKCPLDVLRNLSRSQDRAISYRVAGNPGAPPDLLDALTASSDSGVRSYVAGNPSTSRELLERLAGDHEQIVKNIASQRLRGESPLPARPKLGTLNHALDLLFD